MLKTKIILTGADGFIGSNLFRGLQQEYDIIRLAIPGSPIADEDGVVVADLTDENCVTELMEKVPAGDYAAIVHTAFILCRPNDWQNSDYLTLNNKISLNVAKFAEQIACKALINFSSLAVYPNQEGVFDETSNIDMSGNTEGIYGLAKFNSEMILSFYLGKKLEVVNLRMTQVYGPGMQDDRLVGVLRGELTEKNNITLFGKGERVSNFIYIDDVVQGVAAVLKKPVGGTYNLGHYKNISYGEIAEKLVEVLGNSESKIDLVDKGVSARVEIATKKFEETFGFKCQIENFGFKNE